MAGRYGSAVARPPVDVVVPFRGSPAELEELRRRLARLELREGDSLLVVDNTPGHGSSQGPVEVLGAAGHATPGYARNRGAERGSADWLMFVDADVLAPADLLDLFFVPPPADDTAILGGGVKDEQVGRRSRPVARYAYITDAMTQDRTFGYGPQWGFPQTANAAVRREAFQQVGGFREDIRAGEDADLTFRLRAARWKVERREGAGVVHRSRRTVRGFVAQKAMHGAAAAWLSREYPGGFLPRRRSGLVWWGIRFAAAGLVSAARTRDRDAALVAVLTPVEQLSYEFGRSLRNERPRS
jgi:GT2 family glycosyltransferase